jgi:hypothetical protein
MRIFSSDYNIFIRKIACLYDVCGVKNSRQLASYLQISHQAVSDAKRRRTIPNRWFDTINKKGLLMKYLEALLEKGIEVDIKYDEIKQDKDGIAIEPQKVGEGIRELMFAQKAAQFAVISELHRKKIEAFLPFGPYDWAEIIIRLQSGYLITMKVVCNAGVQDWDFRKEQKMFKNLWYAIVSFEGMIEQIEFRPVIWFVPVKKVMLFVKSKKGKQFISYKLLKEKGAEYYRNFEQFV